MSDVLVLPQLWMFLDCNELGLKLEIEISGNPRTEANQGTVESVDIESHSHRVSSLLMFEERDVCRGRRWLRCCRG